jgi:hypothetical protein
VIDAGDKIFLFLLNNGIGSNISGCHILGG